MFSGSPLFILTLTCLTKDAENVSKMLKARLELKGAAFVYFDIDMSYKRCRKCQQNAQTKIRKGCLRHQQINCTGMEKQGNLKFLTLWKSLLQNKASNLGTFSGTPSVIKLMLIMRDGACWDLRGMF